MPIYNITVDKNNTKVVFNNVNDAIGAMTYMSDISQ